MEPLGIHHVSVNVTDVAESVAFYTNVLGGSVRGDRPDLGVAGAWIYLGTRQVHPIEAAIPPNVGQHFAIRVGDLDAAVGELRSKGVDVEEPFSIGSDGQTFIHDPATNLIELHRVGPATSTIG